MQPDTLEEAAAGRRKFLALAGGAALSLLAAPALAATPRAARAVRSVNLVHARTGERFSDVYFENGRYVAEAMAWVDWVLRDVNVDRSAIMDNRLIDVLAGIQSRLGGRELIVTSGYRCRKTNDRLVRRTRRAAPNSLHIAGEAADFFCNGVSPWRLAQAARRANAGGVGFYPRQGFVHVDVGPVRSWRA